VFRSQVFVHLQVVHQEFSRSICIVQLLGSSKVLLGIQPVSFNIEIHCFLKEVNEPRLDLSQNRNEIVVLVIHLLSLGDNILRVRSRVNSLSLVLIVSVLDKRPKLVCLRIELI